jgi:hypothetical protein
MEEVPAAEIARFRAHVIGTLPQFAGAQFHVLSQGWDSLALECDGWIFKFPRTREAEVRLRREVAILAFLKPRVTMPLPHMVLNDGPVPFSQHLKIAGDSLESDDYAKLDEGRRNALATRMAQLYAELHVLPLNRMQQVGATGVDPWMAPDEIIAGAGPKLPRGYKGFLTRTVAAYRKLSISGDELVFGYFDGHGWNMAFDHVTGMLNGVYDFADSGFGSRHRDLSYSNWISADLTLRIISRYEEFSRVAVNRDLVMLYTSALRLAELAEGVLPDEQGVANVTNWVAELKALGLYRG